MAGAKKAASEESVAHTAAGKPARGRPRSPGGPKPRTPIAVTIRAGAEWQAWMRSACAALGERAGVSRIDSTDVIDAALKGWAKEMGLPAPPARF